MRNLSALFWLVPVLVATGCQGPGRPTAAVQQCSLSHAWPGDAASCRQGRTVFPERLDQGYVIVLPGAMGLASRDHSIVQGLQQADVPAAIEIDDWTVGPGRLLANMCDVDHNRTAARRVAAKIADYQEQYPGRPVYLVGYSGGGGVAVLVLEFLPDDRPVTQAILLAPTLAADYDLSLALSHTERGIANYYSYLDGPVLMGLGTLVGTTERNHRLAGGAIGFSAPADLDATDRALYDARLTQYGFSSDMFADGHYGGHFGWAARDFVARHVGPLLREERPVLPSDEQLAAER